MRSIFAAALVAVGLTASSLPAAPQPAQAPTILRIAAGLTDPTTPLLYAVSAGLFAKAGLTVQLQRPQSGAATAAALIGGASLLGGRGNIIAAFIGVLALGVLNNGMNLLGVSTYYQIAIRALILVAVVAIDALANGLRRRSIVSTRIAE